MGRRVSRSAHLGALERLLRQQPVVLLLGARQVGKTTLARDLVARRPGTVTLLDLENPRDLARLEEPMLALERLHGLIVLDEVQNRPDLFTVLRVLADRRGTPARFLLLGSASPELLRQGSETLAGRVAFHELPGFDLGELGAANWQRLWLRGGFPRAYLARGQQESTRWREDFIRTFLERDLPQLGVSVPAPTLRRFWTMLAHYHGQIWNASEFARSFGVSHTTVRRYVDTLTGAFVVRQLPPWSENIGKRVVKSPKVYIADSGILHALLGLRTLSELESHPKLGSSFEGFALGAVIQRLGARREECFFWATHGGAELDLLIVKGNRRLGFEFKRTDAPTFTRSMASALEDLKLDRLDVVHAGADTFPLHARVLAVAIGDVLKELRPLR